ncbi:MAG: arylsulfotransferase family protein, partial [Humibacter sp.]
YTLQRFSSTMVTAPKLDVWQKSGAILSPGYLFATPQTDQFYPAIYDADGALVWTDPSGTAGTDFRVQQYRGEPVLTFWSGRSLGGNGQGHGVILDTAYRPVGHVFARAGLQADLHEFELTDEGTALITSYPPLPADLSSLGGPKDGWIFDCHVQEIDVESNKLLLNWRASDHISLDESYEKVGSDGTSAGAAYDPYHFNAISADTADTLLLSARHTHAVYSIDRATGDIRWRLGGKKSDFAVDADAKFAWQHHARRRSASTISMFDNHVDTSDGTSRGLLLTVDEDAKTASVAQQYAYKDHVGFAMGSMEPLTNGNVLVGWGTQPFATEFTADGTAVWEATGLGKACYRVARSDWKGTPAADPDIAVTAAEGGRLTVSASWNGATEVDSWRVLSGASEQDLALAATVKKAGFETTAQIPGAAQVRVVALDAAGATLGMSRVVATA